MRVFDTKPITFISSTFAVSKNDSPVSSTGLNKRSPSMSPKKRGKRRIKENMENLEPTFVMSNFNSNNSAKVSDSNLLSSAGSSVYNVNSLS